jgi:multidrug efflux pump subunit AcrA (membrane-fusion protein)
MNGVKASVLVVMIADAVLSRGGLQPDVVSPFIARRTAAGDIVVGGSVNCTVKPTRNVDGSTDLLGMIRSMLVLSNDPVVTGQVLAALDSATS